MGKQSGSEVRELTELSQIGGSLVIQGLHGVIDAKDALEVNLVGKPYLDELRVGMGS